MQTSIKIICTCDNAEKDGSRMWDNSKPVKFQGQAVFWKYPVILKTLDCVTEIRLS